MDAWPKIVESFQLSGRAVIEQYTRIPADACDIFYHYTTRAGLEGILRSGGLRATYRMKMNDAGEFNYARNIVYEELDGIGRYPNLPPVALNLVKYTRKNLDQFLKNTTGISRTYCACLTVSPDHPEQWASYADNGKGFAIGFNLHRFLNMQIGKVKRREPFVFCAPVIYDESEQRALVWRLVKTGICDLKTFAETCSQKSKDITALRDRVTREIVVCLFAMIDFIKSPTYSSEREMRLFLDPNDGTLKAQKIEYFKRGNESIPFIFFDLRNPTTRRLLLDEIKVGPNASFLKNKAFLQDLLDELGYGNNYEDRPRIVQSSIVAS